MNQKTPAEKKWLQSRMILLGAAIVLFVGYVIARPTLEKITGLELPEVVDLGDGGNEEPGEKDSKSDPAQSNGKSDDSLDADSEALRRTPLAKGKFETPEGLIYSKNRLDHVMKHSKDQPQRDQPHGVFEPNGEDQVLRMVDEAFALAKQNNSRRVRHQKQDQRDVYTVEMKRRVGFVGGRVGKRQGHPECQHVRLVLEKRNVITAFPIRRSTD